MSFGQIALDPVILPWFYERMARALRIERPGGRYHVTARGNERKDIFRNDTVILRVAPTLPCSSR